jgi:hypothetical protein
VGASAQDPDCYVWRDAALMTSDLHAVFRCDPTRVWFRHLSVNTAGMRPALVGRFPAHPIGRLVTVYKTELVAPSIFSSSGLFEA